MNLKVQPGECMCRILPIWIGIGPRTENTRLALPSSLLLVSMIIDQTLPWKKAENTEDSCFSRNLCLAHYSKSQIFVQKFNFDKTTTFSRVFHPKFFWQFFSWNQSCQQLKSPKPQHFHEFSAQKIRQFSQEIKVEFLDKKWRFRTVCRD